MRIFLSGETKTKVMLVERLKVGPNSRIPIEELHQQIHQWLPNENTKKLTQTLISWGRYAEYFGYNDLTKTFYLDKGEEA
ncbi:MAG: AAA-associated domain-containing protein [Bdellovibrionaceae bacterium]|nr:AAA-associated domain-containing protein [Pseudobdellovibrionaceae bacterium]